MVGLTEQVRARHWISCCSVSRTTGLFIWRPLSCIIYDLSTSYQVNALTTIPEVIDLAESHCTPFTGRYMDELNYCNHGCIVVVTSDVSHHQYVSKKSKGR